MDLKTTCINNLVETIKKLPPYLKEEVILKSIKSIREEEKSLIIKEVKNNATVVIEDLIDIIIDSNKTGQNFYRPEYTKNIDDELYQIYVDISQNFVKKYTHQLCFEKRSRRTPFNSMEFSDSD